MGLTINADDVRVSEYGINRVVCAGCGREHGGGYYGPEPHTVGDCLAALAGRVRELESQVGQLQRGTER